SWPRSFWWKSAPNAPAVPVTTRRRSSAARRALCPSGYETCDVVGTKPQIQRPSGERIVAFGPSVISEPPRRTVTVIGRPSLDRISVDTRWKLGVGLPSTATTRSPGRRPAAYAGEFRSTSPTRVVGFAVGAPVV